MHGGINFPCSMFRVLWGFRRVAQVSQSTVLCILGRFSQTMCFNKFAKQITVACKIGFAPFRLKNCERRPPHQQLWKLTKTVWSHLKIVAKFPRILAKTQKKKHLSLFVMSLKYLEVVGLWCAIFQNLEVLVFLVLAKMPKPTFY